MLPLEMQMRNGRYKRWQDKMSHLLGRMLLLKGLGDYGYDAHSLSLIQYNSYQRPFLDGDTDFNISHSGHYVLCAIAEGIRIGVDIEEIRPVRLSDFSHVMNNRQWNNILSAQDPLHAFYRSWTIKESVIKADGKGLSIPVTDIEFTNNRAWIGSQNWQLKECFFDTGYAAFLATDFYATEIKVEYHYCSCDQLC